MSVETFSPIPLDVFGTWITLLDPSDVPPGMSPDLRDVDFFPGGVRTRSGLVSQYSPLGGSPAVNGLKTYITTNLVQRLTSVNCASTTSCTLTTPAKSAGAVDVVITNTNGSATCTSCFTYQSASGTTYFTTDFESGLPAGIPGDTGSVSPGCLPVISTAQAHGGTHSALIQSDYQGACGSTSRFDWTGPQSYTLSDLHANGLYWSNLLDKFYSSNEYYVSRVMGRLCV